MNQSVYLFEEISMQNMHLAGGKGRTLAYLYQKGYPVPNGFIILPLAFNNDEISPNSLNLIQKYLSHLRNNNKTGYFAVRSSALSEDSPTSSFAGQFKTILQVNDDNGIINAIKEVRQSRHSKEVQSYSEAANINTSHEMAVIIQHLVNPDISGVLFTADPLVGDRNKMTGNFITGLGDKLVSGKVTPSTFTLSISNRIFRKEIYHGPQEIRKYAKKLYDLGKKLERELSAPQDIEWAIVGKEIYLLQSRPITTVNGFNPITGEWNDSKTGDFVWTNVNFGEAIPQAMTPLSWTVQQRVFNTWELLPGYQVAGNIGGKPYLNISIFATIFHKFGKKRKDIIEILEGILYTKIPANMEIPLITLPKRSLIPIFLNLLKVKLKEKNAFKRIPYLINENPIWCNSMISKIEEINTKEALYSLWNKEIEPHIKQSVWSVMGSVTHFSDHTTKLRRELSELVGPNDADILISNISSSVDLNDPGLLASLGPVLGISRLAREEIDRSEYLERFGHRGDNEFELYTPHPIEETGWLDKQVEQYLQSPVDVEILLSKKTEKFNAAWERFKAKYPKKARKIYLKIKKVAPLALKREAVRSEYVRDRFVARKFALRAGELTSIQDGVFFLTIDELLNVLKGGVIEIDISKRIKTYKKYLSLPSYPSIIRGQFNPFKWGNGDAYDLSFNSYDLDDNKETIIGSPGSTGRIEGVVRIIDNPENGHQLKKGEILVTPYTDINWTLLFPRAAAVITDVGAPLSHAAIVARELGIPAVVGCGNATKILKTGDRVLIDGGLGKVYII